MIGGLIAFLSVFALSLFSSLPYGQVSRLFKFLKFAFHFSIL